jgi:hypothetical protein
LGDVQSFGRPVEVARVENLEEGPRQRNVHGNRTFVAWASPRKMSGTQSKQQFSHIERFRNEVSVFSIVEAVSGVGCGSY